MKTISIILLCCMFILSASIGQTQMVDMISNLAIQGQLTAQGAQQTKTVLNMVQQNKIINQMNMIIADIKMRPNGYAGLSKNQIYFNISFVDWNVGPYQNNQFYIDLKNIDLPSCSKFKNTITNAKQIHVNNKVNGTCLSKNTLKFIFD